MAMDAAVFDADVAAVEADEVNLGTVLQVTLPDSLGTVTGIVAGRSDGFEMQLAGYEEKRRDSVSIRDSLLAALAGLSALSDTDRKDTVSGWAKDKVLTIEGKAWNIESAVLSVGLWEFKLVQSW